jgi:serine protease Do
LSFTGKGQVPIQPLEGSFAIRLAGKPTINFKAEDMRFYIVFLVLTMMLAAATSSPAKIYKYRKNGTWVFTDSPPADMPEARQEIMESVPSDMSPGPGGNVLLKDYPARNAIEKAAMATVAVKTGIGYGSGFFITTVGHILTNKHVIRMTKQQARQIDDYFRQVDHRAEDVEQKFAAEQKRLDTYKQRLDRLKQTAENEGVPSRKASYEEEYRYRKQEFDKWEADFQKRKQAFQSQVDQYDAKRKDFEYSRSVAALSQSFTVILVDDTELYAHLVAVSENGDLALLKVDGYQTPALLPASVYRLRQGDPVYAIGNPANLRNTVTSGIFSGLEGSYIQTNAQISPGNSGGPLIDPDGNVLGINTKKKIGSGFEGLGFAIPIQTALDEFREYLP